MFQFFFVFVFYLLLFMNMIYKMGISEQDNVEKATKWFFHAYTQILIILHWANKAPRNVCNFQDELLQSLNSYNMPGPRYRWRASKWGKWCPVALKQGNLLQVILVSPVHFRLTNLLKTLRNHSGKYRFS